MFFEFLSHLVALDIPWLISLVMNNLFWVFAFIALMYFFTEGKKTLLGFLVITFVMWIWVDWETVSGMALFVGSFLALYYISKIALLAIAENSPSLQKKLFWVSEVQAITAIVLFYLFVYSG